MYLLYGIIDYLIEEEITKIKEKNNINDIDIVKYDLFNTKLEDIIDDYNSISLFNNKKLIIVDNSYIFTGINNKKFIDQNIDVLDKSLDNQNDNIIIFKILKDKLDERKKIVKKFKEKGIVKDLNNFNINKYVESMFNGYKIDYDNVKFFIDRVGDNLDILKQEANKIIAYKDTDKVIKKEDILNLTSKNIDTDFFKFIENIVSKNKEKALESYFEIVKDEEPIKIIVILANKFRLIYQSKRLYKKGYSEKDISDMLGSNYYSVKKCLESSRNYSEEMLLENINKLAQLDIDIKNGKIDKSIGLELFILSL